MNAAPLTLRDSTPDDEPLLFRLFAENKAREFGVLSLHEQQLKPLLAMQYRARCASYATAYPGAQQIVVEEGPDPVGQILLSEDEASIHIVDIAIAIGQRSRGLGTAVLLALQQRAAHKAKEIRLQVIPHSPAHRLYERLGFIVTAHDAMADQMVWPPRPARNP